MVKPPIGATWALKCFVLFCFGGWPHALPKVLVLWKKQSGGSKPGGVSHESPTSLLIQGVLLSLADMLLTLGHTGLIPVGEKVSRETTRAILGALP